MFRSKHNTILPTHVLNECTNASQCVFYSIFSFPIHYVQIFHELLYYLLITWVALSEQVMSAFILL